MGCYGIGVSRIMSAVIEQRFDQRGILWPESLAPYRVIIVVLDAQDEEFLKVGTDLAADLENAGIETLVDDRGQGPGVKFNDAYLLGIPYIVILGKKYRQTKELEVETRKTSEKISLKPEKLIEFLQSKRS